MSIVMMMMVVVVVFNDYQMVTYNAMTFLTMCVKVDDKDEQWFPSGKGAETEILVSEIRREPVGRRGTVPATTALCWGAGN